MVPVPFGTAAVVVVVVACGFNVAFSGCSDAIVLGAVSEAVVGPLTLLLSLSLTLLLLLLLFVLLLLLVLSDGELDALSDMMIIESKKPNGFLLFPASVPVPAPAPVQTPVVPLPWTDLGAHTSYSKLSSIESQSKLNRSPCSRPVLDMIWA